jgi:hypothetical protein
MTSSEDCRVTSVSPTPKDTEAEEAGPREAFLAMAADLRQQVARAIKIDQSRKRYFLRSGPLSQTRSGLFERRGHGYAAVLAVAEQLEARADRWAVLAASPAVTEGERAWAVRLDGAIDEQPDQATAMEVVEKCRAVGLEARLVGRDCGPWQYFEPVPAPPAVTAAEDETCVDCGVAWNLHAEGQFGCLDAEAASQDRPDQSGRASEKEGNDGKHTGAHPRRPRDVEDRVDGAGVHPGAGVPDRSGPDPARRLSDVDPEPVANGGAARAETGPHAPSPAVPAAEDETSPWDECGGDCRHKGRPAPAVTAVPADPNSED